MLKQIADAMQARRQAGKPFEVKLRLRPKQHKAEVTALLQQRKGICFYDIPVGLGGGLELRFGLAKCGLLQFEKCVVVFQIGAAFTQLERTRPRRKRGSFTCGCKEGWR